MKGNSINKTDLVAKPLATPNLDDSHPSKKGFHGPREISGTPILDKLIADASPQLPPPYRSLRERKIKPEQASSGAVLSILGKAILPLIDKFIGLGAKMIKKDFESKIKARASELERCKGDKKQLLRKIKLTEKNLSDLKEKIGDMGEDESKKYIDLSYEQWGNLKDYTRNSSLLKRCRNKLRSVTEERDEIVRSFSKSRHLLKPTAQSALKLVSGLRDIFSRKANGDNAEKVYQINLGDVQHSFPGQFDVKLSDLRISVQDIKKNTDGSLSIEVAECSAKIEIITVEGLKYGPVKIYGGFDLTIKKPMSEDLVELLSCYSVSLPWKVKNIVRKYSKAMELEEDDRNKGDKEVAKKKGEVIENPFAKVEVISDVIDLNISALKVETGSGKGHSVLSEPGIAPILTLLAPGLEAMRNLVGKQKLSKAESDLDKIKSEVEREKKHLSQCSLLLKRMNSDASQLFDDFTKTKQSVKKACAYRIENAREDLERQCNSYRDVLLELEKKLQEKGEAVEALRKKTVHEGEWLRFVENVASVLMSFREIATNKKKESDFSLTHRTGDNTTQAESPSSILQPLKGQAISVCFDENKALHLQLSGLVGDPSNFQGQGSEPLKTPAIITLKINPPAGKLMHRLLTVDFPFDLEKIKGVVDLFAEVAPPGSQEGVLEKLNQMVQMVEVHSSTPLRSEQELGLLIGFLQSIGAKKEQASQLVAHLKLKEEKREPVSQEAVQADGEQPGIGSQAQPQPEESNVAGANTLAPVIKASLEEQAGEESPVDALKKDEKVEAPETALEEATKTLDTPQESSPVEQQSSQTPSREEAAETDMTDVLSGENIVVAGAVMEETVEVEVEGAGGIDHGLESTESGAGLGLSAKRADINDSSIANDAHPGIELSSNDSQPFNNPIIETFHELAVTHSDSQASPSNGISDPSFAQMPETNKAPGQDTFPREKELASLLAEEKSPVVSTVPVPKEESTTEVVQATKPIKSLPIKKLKTLIEVTQNIQGRQAKAHFRLTSTLSTLFDKLSWFTRLFVGSPDLEIEVSTNVDGGEANLAEPVLTVKNGNPLRRFLVNRWLRKALQKKAIAISVDYRGKTAKLSLTRRLDLIKT